MISEKEMVEMDEDIEKLELHDMDPEEVERVVNGMSKEATDYRRIRKGIRYILYKLKSAQLGSGAEPTDEMYISRGLDPNGFKDKFTSQEGFAGWKMFAESWDVHLTEPYRIVHRELSTIQEWDEIVRSKYPTIKPGGQIVYPDLKVKESVMREAELQNQKK